jgi:hypothetical protein
MNMSGYQKRKGNLCGETRRIKHLLESSGKVKQEDSRKLGS